MRFRKDGTFRVLQLADIQDGPVVSPDTIRLIDEAIAQADPDLVVLTGDQIRGYDPAFAEYYVNRQGDTPGTAQPVGSRIERWLTRGYGDVRTQWWRRVNVPDADGQDAHDRATQKVRATIDAFLEPIVRRGIPFAVTYGNHDFQCGLTLDEQDAIYRSYEGCMNPPTPVAAAPPNAEDSPSRETRGDDGSHAVPRRIDRSTMGTMGTWLAHAAVSRFSSLRRKVNQQVVHQWNRLTGQHEGDPLSYESGTFAVPIEASRGDGHAMAVVLVNSGDYEPGGGYGSPSQGAVAWLGSAMDALSHNRPGRLPAIAFQHIPAPEIYDCLKPVSRFTANGIRGYRKFSDRVFVVNRRLCRPGSTMSERPCCGETNTGEVQAMRQAGGYFALFAGHDHSNTFIGDIGNFELGYAPTAGFTSYGPKAADRALRLFVFHEHNPANYETKLLTYGDLVGHMPTRPMRVLFGETMVADLSSIGNWLRNAKVRAVLGAAATFFVSSRLLRWIGKRHG
ncbi:Ser/Thr phosphatase family protein [Bifidobacterium gallicum DSM 20093 = LMG 11596]|uniref:Ser/Thr phosphatase family protein n=1 Tax=Bifidobacterium gallicum DSM 20093 = LMG 11596 TaxID=561180 RepID=D1NV70_9BIFI|nr:Ser/Thr phosphatase family protein [Bifidobacterium gallicum DSM 20093 = LMG 11596]